ncbi:hypothetical protein V502_04790 [Pseudogymnoascus sp. VKM F-4520 (FW-2644)]|nr:hypothetical protein V502_04790 [Pseudogymnoascus sp. VKM F-4520 (FW-2644)]
MTPRTEQETSQLSKSLYISIIPTMSYCLDVDKLSDIGFNDVCVASNLLMNGTSWVITQKAMLTCCTESNYHITDDDCYIYCNITTPYDTVMMSNCLLDTLDTDTGDYIQFDCYPFAWELSSTADTRPGMIATTWSFPDQTWTATDTSTITSGGVETVITVTTTRTKDYWGNPITTTAPAKTLATATATGSSATGIAAAATSSKASKAVVGGFPVSYGAGCLVALCSLRRVTNPDSTSRRQGLSTPLHTKLNRENADPGQPGHHSGTSTTYATGPTTAFEDLPDATIKPYPRANDTRRSLADRTRDDCAKYFHGSLLADLDLDTGNNSLVITLCSVAAELFFADIEALGV